MIGQTISHYRILEKLGEGGMGVVYKAQDTKLDRFVALKFLPSHVASSSDDKARFLQEAKAVASLTHPNICTIHSVEEESGKAFIVMEYIEGKTLKDMQQAVPLKQAIEIGIQIADGLAAAHEKGVVHRDIKPDNIMIRKDGRVQIMDFGLAKLKGVSRLTKEGSTVGTAGYMSPEQVQGLEIDHRTDIFSLGVVLYELFAGESPFKGVHETAITYEIVNVDPEPISSIKPDIDPQLEATVLECLQKESSERFQSAAEVAKELRRFKRETSRTHVSRVTATRSVINTAMTQPPGTSYGLQRRELVFALTSGVLLLLALTIAMIHFRETLPEVRIYRFTLSPPEKTTFVTSQGGHVALSPDGRMVAFVARDSLGKTLLWVRPLSALSGLPLTGTGGAIFPFWSPDSRFIGFFADGKLKKIEATGGPTQTICDALGGRGGTWSRDGIIVFSPTPSAPLSRVPAAGGTPSTITQLDTSHSEISHRWPQFLPDGRHFLYTTRTSTVSSLETDVIYVGSLDSKTPNVLLHASSNTAYVQGHLLFVREQTLMAQPFDEDKLEFTGDAFPIAEQVQYDALISRALFSASESGVLAYQTGSADSDSKLIWFDRSGKQMGPVDKPRVYATPRLSPDGKKLAAGVYDSQTRNTDIWVYDLPRTIRTRFTFDPSVERNPVWSPDGNFIAFCSDRKGHLDLYQKSSSGAGSEELLFESNTDKLVYDWSSDGRYILYNTSTAATRTKADIWVLPLFGDRKPYVFLATEFNEGVGRFSPDVHWIAYQSDESGKAEIYVRPFPGPGGKWQISTAGGLRPQWRRDGREVYFLSGDNKLMAVEVKETRATLEVGVARELFETHPVLGLGQFGIFDVTADGQRFLVNTRVGEASFSPITVAVNWAAELKKK